jgi:hypothetical protein
VVICSGVSRCGRFELFARIVLFGYFDPMLERPTVARVLLHLHVRGYH